MVKHKVLLDKQRSRS